jgi:chorismate mutase
MIVNEVPALQQAIDQIDDQLIELLKRRFEHSRQIGVIKKSAAQQPVDPARVQNQRDRFLGQCAESGLAPGMSKRLLLAITDQVIAERLAAAD